MTRTGTLVAMVFSMVTLQVALPRVASAHAGGASERTSGHLSAAGLERRRCVGAATESCYGESASDRTAVKECMPVRIAACEVAYRQAQKRAEEMLAAGRAR